MIKTGNKFSIFKAVIGIMSLVILSACNNKSPNVKPNIILIMTDDQGWGDMEFAGNNIIDTPNLNKLAIEGVQFERFYVSPMCAPSRASLMTGRYNLRTGTSWVGRRTDFLGLGETTIADILRSEGYATGCYGKWHLGAYGPYHPNERGFDDYTGMLEGASRNYYNTRLDNNGKEFISSSYITDLLTDSALHFIEKYKDQPFFCYLPYNIPHHPFHVLQKDFDKYKNLGVADDRTASVYAMIDNMDENVGRIMDKLLETGLDENTIVIFLSDNGPAFERFNDGLAGIKAQVSEGSVRVPFYIRWKGKIPEGRRIFDIAAHIDVLPTLLDAAGISMPDSVEVDGINLMPLIMDVEKKYPDRIIYAHQTVFGENLITPGGLRTDRYRLVNWRSGYELYDMLIDPSQKRNIVDKEPELSAELIRTYENWYADVSPGSNDLPPVPIGYPGYDTVKIIAPDALLSENLAYSGKFGWVTCYAINWKDVNDYINWPVDVYSPGDYEFILHYWCSKENIGSEFTLKSKNGKIGNVITEGGHDKVIQKELHFMSRTAGKFVWSKMNLGTMNLEKGPQDLVLQAVNIPGENAGEIRRLEIIRKN